MPACSAINCANRTEKGVRLFGFPQGSRNEERRNKWIKNINRKALPSNPFVCEVHFESDQFENNRQDGRRPLKGDAVPTIFEKKSPSPAISEGYRKSQRKRRRIKYIPYYWKTEDMFGLEEDSDGKDNESKIRCRGCLAIETQGHVMKKKLMGTSLKETMLKFVPQLSPTLSDDDSLCDKCCRLLLKFANFVDSCLDVQKRIQNGSLTLDLKDSKIKGTQKPSLVKKEQKDHDEDTLTNNSLEKNETPQRSRRGRKRKQELINYQENQSEDEGNTKAKGVLDKLEKNPEILVVPKRGRGRPRKYPLPEVVIVKEEYTSAKASEEEESKEETSEKTLEETKSTEEIIEIPDNLTEKEKENSKQSGLTPEESTPKESLEDIKDNSKSENLPDHAYASEVDQKAERYRCPECCYDYHSPLGMKRHLIKSHNINENNEFECKLCQMKFYRFKDMLKHKSSHGSLCDMCDEIFKNVDELVEHETTHPEKCVCMKCGCKFKNDELLEKHSSLHEIMMKVKQVIGKQKTQKKFIDHNKDAHNISKDIECSDCGKKFYTKAAIRLHLLKVHSNTKSSQTCETCGESFSNVGLLHNHQNTHSYFNNPNRRTYSRGTTQLASKKYPCPFCLKVENSQEMIIEHLSVHADDRTYQCKYCGVILSSSKTQSDHEETHASDPNYKHVCNVCWKRFSSDEFLKTHEQIHQPNLKLFSCCICGSNFMRKILLENHVFDVHLEKQKTIVLSDGENTDNNNINLEPVSVNDNQQINNTKVQIFKIKMTDNAESAGGVIIEYVTKEICGKVEKEEDDENDDSADFENYGKIIDEEIDKTD